MLGNRKWPANQNLGNKWIPIPISYLVQSLVKHIYAKVQELIDKNSGDWDKTLLYQIFHPEEATIISNMPISKLVAVDKIYWWPTKEGQFSIRST